MTPRQLAGYLELAHARRRRELGEQLALNTLAARGEVKAVQNQIKDLSR